MNENIKRPQVAIYLDYTFRIPSFSDSYLALKQYLFERKDEEMEIEGEYILRDFWREEIKKPEVESFYVKSIPPEEDIKNKNWIKFFYDNAHYLKFIEDYSFNLFVDSLVPNNKDVEMVNIAQKHLFDVVLIDEYMSSRKKTNTFFFLSKTRITPHSVLFLKEGEVLIPEDYLGIWNPKTNSEQENGEGISDFEMWLKDLEFKIKNEESK